MFDLHRIIGVGNQISKWVSELMQLGKRLCFPEGGGGMTYWLEWCNQRYGVVII